ncbi:MAG: DUF3833 family protein [Hasllibacter sp.]
MDALLWIALGAALALAGRALLRRRFSFLGQTSADYADGPAFDIATHLSGPILCEGMIYGPTGKVTSRFTADMHGTFRGGTATLTERFRYDSGTVQDREWRLTLLPGGGIRAEADDLVGTGTGRQEGSAVRLDYRIRLPEEAGGHVLDVTDWMYLLENGTILNRSQFRKFGLKVAELVATMRPARAAEAAPKAVAAE